VVHTHGSVLRNMATLNKVRPLTAEHGLFSNSPFFWVGGLAFSLLSTIIAGGKLICSAASPQETLELLLQEKPNYGNGFAASVLPIANDPGFPKDGLPFMRQGNLYPIMAKDSRPPDAELRHNLLGMTETGSVCTIGDNEDNLPESQRGSYGRPTPGMDARVVDPETGEDSKQGEFWVRGPAVMQGYYGLERHEAFAPGGWYRTGDIMHVDDDGLFYFKGRRNDMIKTSGANVSPREVEGVLADLCPGRNVVVLGLPDPERGQIVTGVVLADEKVDEAKLKLEMRGRLSPYKVPRKIVTLKDDSVPRLSSGKIDMKRLAEMVTQAIADEAKATPEKVG
jgi:acyl-CoA synthetase (AMP-forming)/AMP-acid ligase II